MSIRSNHDQTQDELFRSRLDQIFDLRHLLAVLAEKMPWDISKDSLRPVFEHRDRKGRQLFSGEIFGKNLQAAS